MCGGGNLYTLYTLLSSHSNEMLLKSYFLLSLKVACSVCDFLILKHLLISQKSWCHRQINMEVWKEFFVIYNTYSGVRSLWLKSLQYYNHFQSTIANQRGKPLGRCWSKVGVFPPPPLNCHYSHIFPLFHIISLHPWKVGDTRQYQHLLYHCWQKNIAYNFKFLPAIKIGSQFKSSGTGETCFL